MSRIARFVVPDLPGYAGYGDSAFYLTSTVTLTILDLRLTFIKVHCHRNRHDCNEPRLRSRGAVKDVRRKPHATRGYRGLRVTGIVGVTVTGVTVTVHSI